MAAYHAPHAGAAHSSDPYLPKHGNGGYRTRHYDLVLDYRVEPNRLDGKALITATATQDLDQFALDLIGLRVDGVRVDGRPARHEHRGPKLVVRPATRIAAGAVAGPGRSRDRGVTSAGTNSPTVPWSRPSRSVRPHGFRAMTIPRTRRAITSR